MIWFKCKQCGKTHGRGENLSGTTVFCECGWGNVVPWTSSTEAPAVEEQALPAVPIPRPRTPADDPEERRTPPRQEPPSRIPPRRVPLDRDRDIPRSEIPPRRPFDRDYDREREPPRPPPPPRRRDEEDEPPPRGDLPLPSRRFLEGRRINPAFCLNHDETPSTIACDACRQRFCAACVVTLEGKTLCGPCKNFRLRGLGRAAPVTAWSVLALVAALVSGPVAFCLNIFAFLSHVGSTGTAGLTVVLALLALILPGGSLALAFYALRDIDRRPSAGGRALALTAATAAGLGILWTVTIAGLLFLRQVTG
jgi:hypothetical protein